MVDQPYMNMMLKTSKYCNSKKCVLYISRRLSVYEFRVNDLFSIPHLLRL